MLIGGIDIGRLVSAVDVLRIDNVLKGIHSTKYQTFHHGWSAMISYNNLLKTYTNYVSSIVAFSSQCDDEKHNLGTSTRNT